MRRAIFGGLLAAMTTVGCVTPSAPDPEARRIDVSEAVLRHLFHERRESDRSVVAYCVGLRERFPGPVIDAPPELISRLRDVGMAVKPYSECVSRLQVLDVASGRPALTFHVGPVECREPIRCTATGAYAEASLSGAASEYELERRGKSWVVVSQELRAVS